MVLAMDEESAVNAEGNGIDFRSVDAFDEWVTCDPAHLQQVLPEERGVVAIMARRSEIDYKDPWANKEYNKRNRHTYFLIRNGGALYRMDTNFEVGYRLVPARNEFTSMFLDRHTGQPLVPGTDKWLAAEKLAGAASGTTCVSPSSCRDSSTEPTCSHRCPSRGGSACSPRPTTTRATWS